MNEIYSCLQFNIHFYLLNDINDIIITRNSPSTRGVALQQVYLLNIYITYKYKYLLLNIDYTTRETM